MAAARSLETSRARRRANAVGCAAAVACLLMTVSMAAPAASSNLADAVRRGDLPSVRALLKTGASKDELNAATRDAMTPLLYATQANDVALARLLLEAGADANVANRYGISALWLAATNVSPELVKLLLEHGANAGAAMAHGETAIMAAARSGDAASIKLLLEAGADPNVAESTLGETALMWAAAENHADAIHALAAGGAALDAHAKNLNLAPMNWLQTGMVSTVLPVGGWTAIMYAARQDSQAAVRALAEVGADLDAQDPDGTTALMIAVTNFHYDLAAELLKVGANPNVADRTGMTALYGAVDMVTLGRVIGRPELPRVDTLDAIGFIKTALAGGADPNARLTSLIIARHHGFSDRGLGAGATALMRAAKGYDVESMRVLLDAGADAKLTQADGSNVLLTFASGAAPRDNDKKTPEAMRETLRMILGAGIDINTKITAGSADVACRAALCGPAGPRAGETALHRAARQGNSAMITLLVENGAKLDARDAAGNTAFDLVSQAGRTHNDAVAALLGRLATPQQ